LSVTQKISVHTSKGWEYQEIPIPESSSKNTGQTFQADDPPGVWRPILGLDSFDYLSTYNTYRSFAYACINKKALNLSKADITLFKGFQKTRSEQPINHPFYKLLKSPNSYGQTFKHILWLSSANCDIEGWAYVKINTVQTPFTTLGLRGLTPVELIPLPAKYVQPKWNSQNSQIEYYIYGTEKIMPEQMIRFPIPNPFSNLLPNAPSKAFNFTLDIDMLQSRARKVFFNNDARPTLAVKLKEGLEKEEFDDYYEKINRRQSGVNNNGRIMLIDKDGEISALNGNARELDYVNSREQIIQEIEYILDVNDLVMGRFQKAGLNQRMALISWIENSLAPYAEMVFNEPLSRFVYDYYDKKLFTEMEFDTTDPELQLKEIDMFATHDLATKNELRRVRNWDDYPDKRADELNFSSASKTDPKQDNTKQETAPQTEDPNQVDNQTED
jgi:HK97 family phage portal protein